jgi:hypothetical protein
VVCQLAGGHGEVESLEPLDAPFLELAEVGSQRVLGDPREPADLVVGQALAFEILRWV